MPIYTTSISAGGVAGALKRVASVGGVAASPADTQSGFWLTASIAATAASRAEDLLPGPRFMPCSLAMRLTWLRLRPSVLAICE
jgi:hypothetical protein